MPLGIPRLDVEHHQVDDVELVVAEPLTLERPTDKGRSITIVTDTPVLLLGAGVPGAKPREGYDFAIIDLELDSTGAGTGTFTPAAKVTVKQGVFALRTTAGRSRSSPRSAGSE